MRRLRNAVLIAVLTLASLVAGFAVRQLIDDARSPSPVEDCTVITFGDVQSAEGCGTTITTK